MKRGSIDGASIVVIAGRTLKEMFSIRQKALTQWVMLDFFFGFSKWQTTVPSNFPCTRTFRSSFRRALKQSFYVLPSLSSFVISNKSFTKLVCNSFLLWRYLTSQMFALVFFIRLISLSSLSSHLNRSEVFASENEAIQSWREGSEREGRSYECITLTLLCCKSISSVEV